MMVLVKVDNSFGALRRCDEAALLHGPADIALGVEFSSGELLHRVVNVIGDFEIAVAQQAYRFAGTQAAFEHDAEFMVSLRNRLA
jgi:hypothetical protein